MISVTFNVPGRNFSVRVTDHDLHPTEKTHENIQGAQWYTFSSDFHVYRIIGVRSLVTPEGIYLEYRITRSPL